MFTRSRHFKRIKKFTRSLDRSIIIGAGIILVIGFLAGMSFERRDPSLVLVQQALSGSFRPSSTTSGSYILALTGIKPYTLIVGDHPHRNIVGSWTNDDFMKRWNERADRLADDPPHAVLLSHTASDGKEVAITVALSNPVLNAYAGTLSYTATIVKHGGSLAPSSERHLETFPQLLRSPAVFMDGL